MDELAEQVQALAQTDIEGLEGVDQIPDLVSTLQDVIERLEARWSEEFPEG